MKTKLVTIALGAALTLTSLTACGSDEQSQRERCEADVTEQLAEHLGHGTKPAADGSEKPASCDGLGKQELDDVANAAALAVLSGSYKTSKTLKGGSSHKSSGSKHKPAAPARRR